MHNGKKPEKWVCLVMPKALWKKIQDALALDDTQDSGELQSAMDSIKRTDLKSQDVTRK